MPYGKTMLNEKTKKLSEFNENCVISRMVTPEYENVNVNF
jgi:hypothetical protein